jgi:hypothetical protein
MLGGLISAGVGAVLAALLAFTGVSMAGSATPEPITAPLVVYGSTS